MQPVAAEEDVAEVVLTTADFGEEDIVWTDDLLGAELAADEALLPVLEEHTNCVVPIVHDPVTEKDSHKRDAMAFEFAPTNEDIGTVTVTELPVIFVGTV